jgi:peroxiredoxin
MIGRLTHANIWRPRHIGRAAPRAVTRKLAAGDLVSARQLISVAGRTLHVPDPTQLVHLQLRRFAGCPVCNLHLRSMSHRAAEIADAGINEVIVFHSSADELRPHVADFRFDFVADPDKRLYLEFGVESAPRALLDPRAWLPIVRGVARSLLEVLSRRKPMPSIFPDGGRLGLPADFLIAPDGRVLACKYGTHAYDQWSVDELLRLARPA